MLSKILVSGFGLALIGLARFAFNAVALRFFGEAEAGALNVALSFALLVALPATTLLGATTVRYIAAARGEGREGRAAWLTRLLLGVHAVVLVLSVVPLLVYREPVAADRGISSALLVQALAVAAAYASYQFFRNVLYAVDRVGAYGRLELAGAVAFFAALAGFTALGRGEWLPSAFTAGYGAFAVGAGLLLFRFVGTPRSGDERMPLGEIARYSFYGFLGSTASLGAREIAILIAPDSVPMSEVAYLGLCVSLLTPLQFMPRMLRTVVFTHSAEQAGRGDREGLARSISEVSHWLVLANIPVAAGLMILAHPVLVLLGGSPSVEHLWVLRLLALGAAIEIVATPATNALPGVGNIRLTAWCAVFGLAAAIPIWVGLNETYGLVALSAGLLVASAVKSVIPIVAARRQLGLALTRAPGLAAAAIGATILAVAGADSLGPWPAFAAFVPAILALLHGPIREALGLVRARVNPR